MVVQGIPFVAVLQWVEEVHINPDAGRVERVAFLEVFDTADHVEPCVEVGMWVVVAWVAWDSLVP